MLALSMFTLGFAAAVSVALPAVKRSGQWCDGLGGGAFDFAQNFTLAAWNSTGINANTTGAPLVFGQAGAITGAQFKVLSTFASFPFNEYTSVSLSQGRIVATGDDVVPVGGLNVADGAEVAFVGSNDIDPNTGAQIYCAVADTDPAGHGTGHPFLAVNGDTDSFSLCKHNSQNNVVFKAVEGKSYDFASCYPVKVQVIF